MVLLVAPGRALSEPLRARPPWAPRGHHPGPSLGPQRRTPEELCTSSALLGLIRCPGQQGSLSILRMPLRKFRGLLRPSGCARVCTRMCVCARWGVLFVGWPW